LEKALKEASGSDEEIARLRRLCHKLRHSVYIPKREDDIDNTLATFVNGRPEDGQLKIMFLRESEGVYRFGSKRIYIKLDRAG